MIMASWTKAITDPLKAASDIAQGMIDLRDTVKLGGLVIKLNAEILAAQRGALAASHSEAEMAEEVRALKAEIARFDTWERDKQRYELKEHGSNRAKAYALKEGVEPAETAHSACPDCYQQRQISIVQEIRKVPGMSVALECHVCGWEAYTEGQWRAEFGTKKRR
jgi:ribosomal protein S9